MSALMHDGLEDLPISLWSIELMYIDRNTDFIEVPKYHVICVDTLAPNLQTV